jgi:hypothetical protein
MKKLLYTKSKGLIFLRLHRRGYLRLSLSFSIFFVACSFTGQVSWWRCELRLVMWTRAGALYAACDHRQEPQYVAPFRKGIQRTRLCMMKINLND